MTKIAEITGDGTIEDDSGVRVWLGARVRHKSGYTGTVARLRCAIEGSGCLYIHVKPDDRAHAAKVARAWPVAAKDITPEMTRRGYYVDGVAIYGVEIMQTLRHFSRIDEE